MEEFLGTYYLVIIAITIILILALIGYFIDKKHPDEIKLKNEDAPLDSELLKQQIAEKGATLQESINNGQTSTPTANQDLTAAPTVQTPPAPETNSAPTGLTTDTNQNEVDSL